MNPVAFTVTFGASDLTVSADAAILPTNVVIVRVAIWKSEPAAQPADVSILLGPTPNTFNADTRALAETARDDYAAANPTWLATYDGEHSFAIVLSWPTTATSGTFQVRESSRWLDISGLTVQVGGLEPGNAALDELRYRNGAWTPVSPVTTSYGAWTRENTFASLNTLFDDVAGLPGGVGRSADGILGLSRGNSQFSTTNITGAREQRLDAIWPSGESAPWFWLITPTFYGWLSNFTINFTVSRGNLFPQRVADLNLSIQAYTLTIDGVPYELSVIQCPFVRPLDTDVLSVSFKYNAPLQTARVVTQIT